MSTHFNLTPTRTFLSPTLRKTHLTATIVGRGTNVDQQRTSRRRNLINHFKSMRAKTLENFRNLKDDDLDFATLIEIKRRLSQANADEIVDVHELEMITSEVIAELELLAVEKYEREYIEEVNTDVRRLMSNTCLFCKNFVLEASSICSSCTEEVSGQLQDVLPYPTQ